MSSWIQVHIAVSSKYGTCEGVCET